MDISISLHPQGTLGVKAVAGVFFQYIFSALLTALVNCVCGGVAQTGKGKLILFCFCVNKYDFA